MAQLAAQPAVVQARTEWRVELPLPPSANRLFVTRKGGKGRTKTQEYRDWIEAALPLLGKMVVVTTFPTCFTYVIRGKVNESSDGDNMQKPLLDLCVRAGIIPNDNLRHVSKWGGEYDPDRGAARVEIRFGQERFI